jgi:beta-glucosidase
VGARQALAPVLDVIRDPRWGRSEETYGEDPYLIGQIGSAYVRGLQTGDLADGVAATGKHFAGYGASEGGLNWAPSHISERELREIYAAPFETAINEAGLATVMNGYHELDGIPCGASRKLLGDLLRGEIGFEGALVADYFTVENLLSYHHVAADQTEAARLALEAGIDIELPALVCYGEPLRQGLADGRSTLAGRYRRRQHAAPEVPAGPLREALHGSAEVAQLSRRRTARLPAGWPPSRSCCSRTRATCCPCARTSARSP